MNCIQIKKSNIAIQVSLLLVFGSLFFQSHEDGLNQIIYKFNDRLIFLFGMLGLLFYGCSKKINSNFVSISVAVFAFFSSGITVYNIPMTIYDGALEFKYYPIVYMLYYAMAMFLIGLIALFAKSNSDDDFQWVINFFALFSASFVMSFILYIFGIDLDWGIDHSYDFPRIQGLMIEPSYSGYVFFFFYCLSYNLYSRLLFLICCLASFSVSVYAGLFVYFAITKPKLAAIFLLGSIIFIGLFSHGENFFADKFYDIYSYVMYGEITSGNAFRMQLFFDALDFNYDIVGHGLGSPLYVVGVDQTIIPNLLSYAYETGFFGLFLYLALNFFIIRYLTRPQVALIFFCFTYGFVNGGNILIQWIAIITVLLFPKFNYPSAYKLSCTR